MKYNIHTYVTGVIAYVQCKACKTHIHITYIHMYLVNLALSWVYKSWERSLRICSYVCIVNNALLTTLCAYRLPALTYATTNYICSCIYHINRCSLQYIVAQVT